MDEYNYAARARDRFIRRIQEDTSLEDDAA
jgi:hypothetical protein